MLQGYIAAALEYIEKSGGLGFFLYHVGLFLQIVSPIPIPITPWELAGGFLFKNTYGLAVTSFTVCMTKFAANLGTVWVARNFLKDKIMENVVKKNELLTLVSQGIEDEPYKLAFLIRGAMIPLSVKNYGLGVMEVGYLPIIAGSLIFTPVYGFRNLYIGHGMSDLAEVFSKPKAGEGPLTWQDTFRKMLPIFCNLFVVIVTIKIFMSAVAKQRKKVEEGLKDKKKNTSEEKKDATLATSAKSADDGSVRQRPKRQESPRPGM